jgi:hypothetical protein
MMLVRALLSLAVLTGTALAFPAAIGDDRGGGGAPVPLLKRGASLDVICPKIEQIAADAVRVVMYPGREDTSSGVAGVLVMERTIAPGVVHVRVPDIPDLRDHVVRVKVIYPGADGNHACDAGSIKLI